MKKLTLLLLSILVSGWNATASEDSNQANRPFTTYNDSFIFVEGGVEFAVYPNGEFDFYYNPAFRRGSSFSIASPNVNISYNSGYNYDPYIQYDDYGAVIQVEDVPIYYDYYGRIVQAGNIVMNYNNFGMLASVGNLVMHYNPHHRFTHCTGYINSYNRRYVHRPWHDYYRRPSVNVSIVFNRPYRAYYQPRRVTYAQYTTIYNNYYSKHPGKRNFYRPSQKVKSYHYGDRVTTRRAIGPTNRSNYNSQQSRSRVADRSVYQSNKSRSSNSSGRSADVYSSRNKGRTTQSSRSSSDRVYSGKAERSTNSRGRSSSVISSERKSDVSRPSTSSRSSSTRSRTVQPQNRDSKVQSQGRSSRNVGRTTERTIERKPSVQRQSTQSSSNRSSGRNTTVQRSKAPSSSQRSTGRSTTVQRSQTKKTTPASSGRLSRSGSSRGRSNG